MEEAWEFAALVMTNPSSIPTHPVEKRGPSLELYLVPPRQEMGPDFRRDEGFGSFLF